MRWPIARLGLSLNYFFMILATSTFVLFGFFQFINLWGIRFFYVYTPKIVDLIVFSPGLDSWIWASSLLIVVIEVLVVRALGVFRVSRWAILLSIFVLLALGLFLFNAWWGIFFGVPLG